MRDNLLKSIGGILICGYILLLAMQDKLSFYTHPRYHIFAAVMAVLAIALLLVDIFFQYQEVKSRKSETKHPTKRSGIKLASVIAIFVLILGYGLPPKALSPDSITQREGPLITSLENRCEPPKKHEGQQYISINRWLSALELCKDSGYFDGESVELVGFVSRELINNYGYSYFYLARYLISCCAVDSVPVKILIDSPKQDKYPDGSWLRIKGKLLQKVVNGRAEYIVKSDHIDSISQPKQPYELLGL